MVSGRQWCSLLFLLAILYGLGSTGSVQALLISEVFVDGRDEYIELYNETSQDFSGSVSLIGVKSTPLDRNISLAAGAYFLIGDTADLLTTPLPGLRGQGLSLGDTAAIDIYLEHDGEVIDSFSVDAAQVDSYNDSKTSFEKLCTSSGSCTTTPATHTKNILAGYTATPGAAPLSFDQEPPVATGASHTGATTSGTGGSSSPIMSGGTIEDTGLGSGGNLGSGTDLPIDDQGSSTTTGVSPSIRVREIYPYDTDDFAEYIVLQAMESIATELTITGLGRGSSAKSLSIDLDTGSYLYIGDAPPPPAFSGMASYLFPSITLTDNGEELIISSNDEVLDTVVYATFSKDYTAHYNHTTGAKRFFDTIEESWFLGTGRVNGGDEDADRDETIPDQSMMSGSCYILTNLTASGYTLSLSGNLIDCTGTGIIEWSGEGVDTSSTGCSSSFSPSEGATIITASYSSGESYCHASMPILHTFKTITTTCEAIQNSPSPPSGDLQAHISEIYAQDTHNFPEYIELIIDAPYQGEITIDGLGQGAASKTIAGNFSSGQRLVLTDDIAKFPLTTTTIALPSISLTNSGEELQLRGQDGQVVDIVVYTGSISGKSQYFSSFSGDTEIRLFGQAALSTPGFAYEQVAFLLEKDSTYTPNCAIRTQNTTPFFSANKVNLVAYADGKEIANSSSSYSCTWSFGGSTYSYEGCNPSYYDYPAAGVYEVALEIINTTTDARCATSTTINYPAKPSASSPSSQQDDTEEKDSYYEGLYHKRKTRFQTLKQQTKAVGYSVSTTGIISSSTGSPPPITTLTVPAITTGVVRIDRVLPNPQGRDTEAEQIQITNISNTPIDLVTLKISNGKTRKSFPVKHGTLLAPQTTATYIGNLGLRNSSSCITLQSGSVHYAGFCYPQAADDVWFDESLAVLEEVAPDEVGILSKVKLKLFDDKVCALLGGDELVCRSLAYTTPQARQRRKDAKKYLSTQKKREKEKLRGNKWKDKYHEQVQKRRDVVADYQARVAAEKETNRRYRSMAYIHSSFVDSLLKVLREDWGALYYASDLYPATKVYRAVVNKANHQEGTYDYYGLALKLDDLATITELEVDNELPLGGGDMEVTYASLRDTTKADLATLRSNLMKK